MVNYTQETKTQPPTETYKKIDIPTTLPVKTQEILKITLSKFNGRTGVLYLQNGILYDASDWENKRRTESKESTYSFGQFEYVPTNSVISTYDKNNQIIHYRLKGSKDPFEKISIWNDKQGTWVSGYNGRLTDGCRTLHIYPRQPRESNLLSFLRYFTNINSSLVITLPNLPVISKSGDSILNEPINFETLTSITKLLSKPGKPNAYFISNKKEYDYYAWLKTQLGKSRITNFSDLPCGTILSSYNFKNEKVHYLITKIDKKKNQFELSVWNNKKNQWLNEGYYASLKSNWCAHVLKKASVDATKSWRKDERIDRLDIYIARSEQLIVITVPDVDKLKGVPKKTK